MGASITLAGADLIAQKQIAQEGLDVVQFIFANVPGLDHSAPVDRAAGLPDAGQIVYTATIPPENKGYVNPHQVVYSLQVGSDVGDWDFNWIGLKTAEGVLFAVSYVPLQQKRRNIPPMQIGNNVTRNFLVVFDGAQALTGITIDASTWQHDFTVRLASIDKRERLSTRDIYGRSCFFGTGLQLEKVGSTYQLKPGTAFVEGIRISSGAPLAVVPPALPATAWLDVSLERQLSDVVVSWSVVWGAAKVDYTDSAGTRHYCVPLADLPDSNTISDQRTVEPVSGPLVGMFAFRTGDYPNLRARATTKEDVGLGTLPNAKGDDPDADDGNILATTKATKKAKQDVLTVMIGQVAMFAMGTPPSGWLKCNGAAVSRTAYADLFAKIGTTYGTGNGSTTFNLPDLRGEFPRGWDDGRGIDAGRALGSAQAGEIQSHTHAGSSSTAAAHAHTASSGAAGAHSHWFGLSRELFVRGTDAGFGDQQMDGSGLVATNTEAAHTHPITVDAGGAHSHTITINATGGTETRPRNVALQFCIRH